MPAGVLFACFTFSDIYNRMKFSNFTKFLIAANFVMLIVGSVIYLRHNKMRVEDQKFLQQSDYFAQGFVKHGGLTKEEVLEGMLINHYAVRDGHISDKKLDRLLYLMNKEFSKEPSGNAMSYFGNIFDSRLKADENQKRKIGVYCIKIAREATDTMERKDALYSILLMGIKSAVSDIAVLQNDPNPEVAQIARRIVSSYNASKAKKAARSAK